jgi:histidyl-tRNA synthetase
MANNVTTPRGMPDFLPAGKARRGRELAVIRQTSSEHGFEEIETPVVEDYERLHSGLGGDNEKLSFSVLKRGLSADDLAARRLATAWERYTPHLLATRGSETGAR